MEIGLRTHDRSAIPWVIAGTVFLVLVVAVMWRVARETNPAKDLAFKATRVDLVGRMQVALASASEAEKSAVLAITDEESRAFADQARAATAGVEQERQELGKLLATGGTAGERELLAHFSDAFGNLRRIDEEVLLLAVKNTNLKAYALAFGPAARRGGELMRALSRVAKTQRGAARDVLRLASGARIGVLRIQALLAPHIAEESDAKMDQLEATMAGEDGAGPQGPRRPRRAARPRGGRRTWRRPRPRSSATASSSRGSSRSRARTPTSDRWSCP